jgi:putative Holliday junction resolvase
MGRVMGIDFGTRRVGVSISDPGGVVAGNPSVLHVRSQEQAITEIRELATREAVAEIVVGLPLSLDGTSGPQAEKVTSFASKLSSACGVKVTLWDERLSTAEAERLLLGVSKRTRKKKEKRDLVAALLILQSYLSSRVDTTRQEGSRPEDNGTHSELNGSP